MHFEDLWELCENFHKDNNISSSKEIIDELIMKIKLYYATINYDSEDMHEAKSNLVGEILLLLTSLSYKDNINVFTALQEAFKNHNIETLSHRYRE